MSFKLVIGAFTEGAVIPRLNSCDGADLAPAMEWSGEPAGTRSFAVIVDDPDAPGGTWNHCLLFDISSQVHTLAQGFKPGHLAVSGTNDFGRTGYNGPCPPSGHGPHRYFFKVLALDVPALNIAPGSKRAEIERAMRGHILAHAEYMGRYERK